MILVPPSQNLCPDLLNHSGSASGIQKGTGSYRPRGYSETLGPFFFKSHVGPAALNDGSMLPNAHFRVLKVDGMF